MRKSEHARQFTCRVSRRSAIFISIDENSRSSRSLFSRRSSFAASSNVPNVITPQVRAGKRLKQRNYAKITCGVRFSSSELSHFDLRSAKIVLFTCGTASGYPDRRIACGDSTHLQRPYTGLEHGNFFKDRLQTSLCLGFLTSQKKYLHDIWENLRESTTQRRKVGMDLALESSAVQSMLCEHLPPELDSLTLRP